MITLESSDFMSIAKVSFKAVLVSSPEISLRIMKGLVKRLREADKKIETLALLDVYGRVARVLLDFSEPVGNDRIVKNMLSKPEPVPPSRVPVSGEGSSTVLGGV